MSEELQPNLEEVIDSRFWSIESELYVIRELFQALERQLPVITATEVERLRTELLGADEYEHREMENWMVEFSEEVLPRSFRGPILVALWAIFESAVVEISELLRSQGKHRLGIEHLRGGNFFERAGNYFNLVLGLRLAEADAQLDPIRMLLTVRNVIAHTNGRLDAVKAADIKKIDKWERENVGLTTDYGHLTFTKEFVEYMIESVSSFLEDLIRRIKENNPSHSHTASAG